MSKEYITFISLLNSANVADQSFLKDCMNVIHNYTTKRFVSLKKQNMLGSYDAKNCDEYRRSQTFIDEKNKEQTILDARYARAIDISIQARCESLLECKKAELEHKTLKKEKYQENFDTAQQKYNNSKKFNLPSQQKNYHDMDYWNDKLNRINHQIDKLNHDIENKICNGIVFGGRSLFKKQHKSGVKKDLWKKEWENRADEFQSGGSMSEEYGNKQFQMTVSKVLGQKMFFNIKINVPYTLRSKYGDSYILENVYFPRGQELLFNNVKAHEAFLNDMNKYNNLINKQKKEKKEKESNKEVAELEQEEKTEILKPSAKDYGCKSVSMLFKQQKNGEYYVHISITKDEVEITTTDKKGVVAIDINHENISMAEINHVGQLIHSKVFRFNFGKHYSADHREQMINKSINEIVAYAKLKNKHVVMENLDFFHTKAQQLKRIDKDYNRMLHSLAYAKVGEKLRISCLEAGVMLEKVSAAYSSMLGKTLYTKKYGISVHQAAAYVLARRYYKLREYYHVPKIDFIYKDQSCCLTIPADIMKEQTSVPTHQFYQKLYTWLSREFKAPSRFYKRATLISSVDQPAITI